MNKICVLIVFFSLSVGAVFSQTTDREFADYYYKEKSFDKALLYYEKLYDESYSSYYYQRLLDCYIQTQTWKEAHALAKKELRKSKNDHLVYGDIGRLYLLENEKGKAEKSFKKAIENTPINRSAINQMAKQFTKLGAYGFAEELYKQGQLNKSVNYGFHLELASLYGEQGQIKEMIDSYINLAVYNPGYLRSIQSSFHRYLEFTTRIEESELLRKSILKSIQGNPDNVTLNELFIWYCYQVNLFDMAWSYVKSLDNRLQEKGKRILEFARLCAENEKFDLAGTAYNYLINDPQVALDEFVIGERAKTSYLELQSIINPALEKINEVEEVFRTTFKEIPLSLKSAYVYLEWADFLFRYKNQTDSAIVVLQKIIDAPNIFVNIKAFAKLALGDIYIVVGEIWEASLLYSQVDMAFKEDPLGAEAKYRNARVAYYTGDFEWAQAQLDVLKASTSKLTSNDALDLSLIITDNFNLDTVVEPMQMFARAELLTFQRKYDEALILLDSISSQYLGHALSDEILMEKYEIYTSLHQFEEARDMLLELEQTWFFDIYGDDAVFLLGKMNEDVFGDKEKAMEYYKKLMTDYSGSLYVVEARKRFRALRGDEEFVN